MLNVQEGAMEEGGAQTPPFPKVSVITVVLNRFDTIERCINSVIGQTYPNIEYIIVDGGSTDGTLNILSRYEGVIDRVVPGPDSGIYNAMNKGIALARGDFVILLNADDWYHVSAISSLVSEALETNADITHADAFEVNESGEVVGKLEASLDAGLFTKGMPLRHETMLVKRQVYEALGGYDETYRILSDYLFTARLFLEKYRFSHLPVPLMYFSMQGVSNTEHEIRLVERERFFLEFFPMLAGEDARVLAYGAGWKKRLKLLHKYGAESELFRSSITCTLGTRLLTRMACKATLFLVCARTLLRQRCF